MQQQCSRLSGVKLHGEDQGSVVDTKTTEKIEINR
jgi:hypothetical protein